MHWNILALVHMFSRFVRELEFTGVWPFTPVICPWIGVYWHLPIYSRGQSLNWNTLILANIFPQTLLELEHSDTSQYTPVVNSWIWTKWGLAIHSRVQSTNWNLLTPVYIIPPLVRVLELCLICPYTSIVRCEFEYTDTCRYTPVISSWIWIYWHLPSPEIR